MSIGEQLVYLLKGLPDWIAWRMEAWVVRMKDITEGTGIDVLHR